MRKTAFPKEKTPYSGRDNTGNFNTILRELKQTYAQEAVETQARVPKSPWLRGRHGGHQRSQQDVWN